MKSGPPQILTYYFFSPSTHRSFHADATPNGLQPHPDELAFSPYTLPIAADFVSLEDALAQVRKSSGSDILVSEADLRVYWNAAGQPERTAWKIAFSQGSGIAQTSLTQYVDAASGAIVAVEDRSVPPPNFPHPNPGAPAAELPTDNNFAAFRQAADHNVATRGAGFKLYAADLLFELPEPEGHENPGSKVRLNDTHFEYARTTPTVNWESVGVRIGYSSLHEDPESSLETEVGPLVQQAPPKAMPNVLPDDLPDPEPWLRELRDSFPHQHTLRDLYRAGQYDLIEGGAYVITLTPPMARAWLAGKVMRSQIIKTRPPESSTASSPRARRVTAGYGGLSSSTRGSCRDRDTFSNPTIHWKDGSSLSTLMR